MIPHKLQHIAQHLCIPSQVLSDMQCIVQHSRTLQHTIAGNLAKFTELTQRAQNPRGATACTGATAEG